MTTPVKFQLRRDTANNWSTNNPVLLYGEPGLDSTNNQLRIGNGVTGWNYLDQLDVKSNQAIYIGRSTGATQGDGSVSIGTSVSGQTQGINCISIGLSAGATQGIGSVAIGASSGGTQGIGGIAIGNGAGYEQDDSSIAIGSSAATNQGTQSVALGENAAMYSSSNQSVSIGYRAGFTGQQDYATAIGFQAGEQNQGLNSIAIGSLAGNSGQANYTTIINATSAELNGVAGQTGCFYVAPIRSDDTQNLGLAYNTSTKEIVTSTTIGLGVGITGITGAVGVLSPATALGYIPFPLSSSLIPGKSYLVSAVLNVIPTVDSLNTTDSINVLIYAYGPGGTTFSTTATSQFIGYMKSGQTYTIPVNGVIIPGPGTPINLGLIQYGAAVGQTLVQSYDISMWTSAYFIQIN